MTEVLDSIRQVVAEDAAHGGVTHEVYLTEKTVRAIEDSVMLHINRVTGERTRRPTVLGLPLHVIGPDRRDCIATIRGGQVISVTNL